jgi:hypothetical protein
MHGLFQLAILGYIDQMLGHTHSLGQSTGAQTICKGQGVCRACGPLAFLTQGTIQRKKFLEFKTKSNALVFYTNRMSHGRIVR